MLQLLGTSLEQLDTGGSALTMTVRSAQPARRDALIELLSPLVNAAGFDLEDVTVTAAGRRSLIRVVIDSDSGVDLDAIAEVARAVSEALDADSPDGPAFNGPYVLEVSSPGVDRLLTEERHWRRAVGRVVHTELDGAAVSGRIVGFRDGLVCVGPAGLDGAKPNGAGLANPRLTEDRYTEAGLVEAMFSDLAPGRIEVEFSRPGQIADFADADADAHAEAEFDAAADVDRRQLPESEEV